MGQCPCRRIPRSGLRPVMRPPFGQAEHGLARGRCVQRQDPAALSAGEDAAQDAPPRGALIAWVGRPMVAWSDATGIVSKNRPAPRSAGGGALTEHDSTIRWVMSCKTCQDVVGLLHLARVPDGPPLDAAGLHHAPGRRALVHGDAHPTTPIQIAAATQKVLATLPESSTSRRPLASRVPQVAPSASPATSSSRSNAGSLIAGWVVPEVCCAVHGRPSAARGGGAGG